MSEFDFNKHQKEWAIKAIVSSIETLRALRDKLPERVLRRTKVDVEYTLDNLYLALAVVTGREAEDGDLILDTAALLGRTESYKQGEE